MKFDPTALIQSPINVAKFSWPFGDCNDGFPFYSILNEKLACLPVWWELIFHSQHLYPPLHLFPFFPSVIEKKNNLVQISKIKIIYHLLLQILINCNMPGLLLRPSCLQTLLPEKELISSWHLDADHSVKESTKGF